ncbi:Tripartite ATP-independent periplasmic transporter DctQ component [Ancylobacter novellus DSM 506]|uniref:TRAP transporter small permease protein n=2 Tax=Ancylobacter novellus TaxID=921 RepID=D7A8K3_ANCN5|nr:TRAP transporter small permease [Ancylobacter novellus]ADH90537.1 Tripartite ATP-independent periplasmic transporter DctQ component [Ancylobacter novellus DSM 506]
MNAPLNPAKAGWSAPATGDEGAASNREARHRMGALRRIRRVLGLLSTVSLWISGMLLVVMTASVGWQVFGRYVLNDTPNWAEPLSLQFMSWFILLGAAVGVRDSVHLGLDLLHHVAPGWAQKAMDVTSLTLVALFGFAMAWYGAKLAIGTWTATIPVLGWPGGVDFFPLVLGGALIGLFALERLVDTLIGVEVAADTATPELV